MVWRPRRPIESSSHSRRECGQLVRYQPADFLPLSLLAENSDFQPWWRIVEFVLCVLTAIIILAWVAFGTTKLQNRAYLFVGMVAAYVVSGFFVYLCGLAIGTRLWGKSDYAVSVEWIFKLPVLTPLPSKSKRPKTTSPVIRTYQGLKPFPPGTVVNFALLRPLGATNEVLRKSRQSG